MHIIVSPSNSSQMLAEQSTEYPCLSTLTFVKISELFIRYQSVRFKSPVSWGVGVLSCSVMSDSLRLFGLWPARLLCPWDFFKQEYWSGLLFSSPGDLPNPGVELTSPVSLALQADSLPTESSGKPLGCRRNW